MNLERKNDETENSFIRNNKVMLKNIFGTTNVTPYWVADMDFTIAPQIKKELQRLVDRGNFAYEFSSLDVFKAISNWYQRRHQLTLNTDNFVQVTGVLTGIALLIRELTKEGDSILIQTPAYHQFSKVISTANRTIVKNPLKIEDGKYEIDFKDLSKKMSSEKVKAMILCSPHNPVGRVWRKEELEQILLIAKKHNVTIISDEIHSDIIYQGHKFISLMASGANNHVALIGSPSKTFGMQSISNGYIYTENKTILENMRLQTESLYLDHGNAFTTFATIAAFEHAEEWLNEFLGYMQGNIDWISQFLMNELPSIKMFPVEGTYQVWLDFSATGFEGNELTKIVGEAGFGVSPGTWFSSNATQFTRMNFASPREQIKTSFERLKNVLAQSSLPTVVDKKEIPSSCC
ncbi:putative C-S lyase [Pseudoalteromonas sp. SG45-5]|uniref:MalY/PatB family protein n=1 Tax=unclassified Pseudoalteromonas TaxID=194690 RepID=UPI0015FC88E1|nr:MULTISPECIES: PatB family C-S lyase [unclassified Pseudoalteromonas]MBB1387483.1 putative C-S lyase [Pseudoalteromonas sp. SG45-5]MBB1395686.1 putative C-S lyase [Pseudoalteromonas sp. SG44-4]MBB1448272.1 putative C-S lyase [Pseudoalteromonas sp. SG41-6]